MKFSNAILTLKDLIPVLGKFGSVSASSVAVMCPDDKLEKTNLQRNFKLKKNSKIVRSPKIILRDFDIDLNPDIRKKYVKQIALFIDTLSNSLPKENLVNFYENIEDLKPDKSEKFIKKVFSSLVSGSIKDNSNFCAYYNSRSNSLDVNSKIDNEFLDSCVLHELFHMSSRKKVNDEMYLCGFAISKTDGCFGRGISEGFTEYLRLRYFPSENFSYSYFIMVVENLEKLIGKEKMEHLYFNANLDGFVNELEKYDSRDNILKFVLDVDQLLDDDLEENNSLEIDNRLESVNNFLVTCYLRKTMLEKDDKVVNSEVIEKLNSFIEKIPYVNRNNKNFVFVDIEKCLNSVIETNGYGFDLTKEQLDDIDKTWISDYFDYKTYYETSDIGKNNKDKLK